MIITVQIEKKINKQVALEVCVQLKGTRKDYDRNLIEVACGLLKTIGFYPTEWCNYDVEVVSEAKHINVHPVFEIK